MELQIGLAIVDEMTGGKETRQLMDGWMGWESRTMRRLRAVSARVLLALATRLAPADAAPVIQAPMTAGTAQS